MLEMVYASLVHVDDELRRVSIGGGGGGGFCSPNRFDIKLPSN